MRGTSPVLADTDGDGLPDAWEVRYGLNAVSPAGANGAAGDPDLDTLNNLAELAAGTNPTSADTDGDGLADGDGDGLGEALGAGTQTSPLATLTFFCGFSPSPWKSVPRRMSMVPSTLPSFSMVASL